MSQIFILQIFTKKLNETTAIIECPCQWQLYRMNWHRINRWIVWKIAKILILLTRFLASSFSPSAIFDWNKQHRHLSVVKIAGLSYSTTQYPYAHKLSSLIPYHWYWIACQCIFSERALFWTLWTRRFFAWFCLTQWNARMSIFFTLFKFPDGLHNIFRKNIFGIWFNERKPFMGIFKNSALLNSHRCHAFAWAAWARSWQRHYKQMSNVHMERFWVKWIFPTNCK